MQRTLGVFQLEAARWFAYASSVTLGSVAQKKQVLRPKVFSENFSAGDRRACLKSLKFCFLCSPGHLNQLISDGQLKRKVEILS